MRGRVAATAALWVVAILSGGYLLLSHVRANVAACNSGAGQLARAFDPQAASQCAANIDAYHWAIALFILSLVFGALFTVTVWYGTKKTPPRNGPRPPMYGDYHRDQYTP